MTSVRRATPDDARAIAEIQVAAWRAADVGVMPDHVLDELDARARGWRSYTAAPDAATFVAERDGRSVGFVSLGPSRDPEGLGELYAIRYRLSGLGRF